MLLDLHNETCVALANLQWSITKNPIERSNLPIFSYGYNKYMFVDFVPEYNVGSLNYVHCSLLSVE